MTVQQYFEQTCSTMWESTLFVRLYIYICVYIFIFIYIYLFMYLYLYTFIYLNLYIYMFISMDALCHTGIVVSSHAHSHDCSQAYFSMKSNDIITHTADSGSQWAGSTYSDEATHHPKIRCRFELQTSHVENGTHLEVWCASENDSHSHMFNPGRVIMLFTRHLLCVWIQARKCMGHPDFRFPTHLKDRLRTLLRDSCISRTSIRVSESEGKESGWLKLSWE